MVGLEVGLGQFDVDVVDEELLQDVLGRRLHARFEAHIGNFEAVDFLFSHASEKIYRHNRLKAVGEVPE